ncbi:MAG: AMIN domain-containing protein [Deltaproteobacteria bacterium]|nr:AMIN domain-containing protein [Deltaproteobacteria bacterium]
MRYPGRMMVLGALLASLMVPGSAGSQTVMNQLKKVEARKDGRFSLIVIKSASIPNFTSFKLSDPYRLIIDFSETELSGAKGMRVGDGLVDRVDTSQHGSGAGTISRVVVTLSKNAKHRFKLQGNNLVVRLEPMDSNEKGERLAASASTGRLSPEEQGTGDNEPVKTEEGGNPPGSAVFSDSMPSAGPQSFGKYSGLSAAGLTGKNKGGEPYKGSKVLEWVGFEQLSQYSRVFIRTSENPEYRVTVPDDTTVVVELPNTNIDKKNNLRFLDTSAFDSVVDMITPFQESGRVAVEIKLRTSSRYRDFREGKFVVIDFPRPVTGAE